MPTPASFRIRYAINAALLHLFLSLSIALIIGALVFGLWFPWPYREFTGGRELFLMMISVDAICGPLLTLVLFSSKKPKSELVRDLVLIVTIQSLALGYGLHTLALVRPVALVFEVDRFRAVSMADLDKGDSANLPSWLRIWSLSSPKLVGTRSITNREEVLENIEKSSIGIETGHRPSWWQDYELNAPDALGRAKPISDLALKYPTQRTYIDEAVARTSQPESSLRWLPLVSHRVLDWTVLIDAKTAEPVGYVHLDGF